MKRHRVLVHPVHFYFLRPRLCMNHIHQISISKGGVPKLPVLEAQVELNGLLGDKQKNKQFHGGPERAICLFSLQIIERLQSEGHPIHPGSTGENLTISFDQYENLVPGSKLKIGAEVILEISSYTVPCKTIKDSFQAQDFTRISQKLFPGSSRLYARVVQTGLVRVGDVIEVLV